MKTKLLLSRIAKPALSISILILLLMQMSVLSVHAGNNNVKLRWGTTSSFNDSTGGVITPDGKTAVLNGGSISYPDNATGVTFTIVPVSGYIASVECKNGNSNFTIGTGTTMTPVSNKVSLNINNTDWVIQVTFTQVTAHNVFVR
ncbi:MAG: hypothetical protein WCI45_12795, partial [Desulfuromonadales bacterium]